MGYYHNDAAVEQVLKRAVSLGSLSAAANELKHADHGITNIDMLFNKPTKQMPEFRFKENLITEVKSLVKLTNIRNVQQAYFDLDNTVAKGYIRGGKLTDSVLSIINNKPIKDQMMYSMLQLDRQNIVDINKGEDLDYYKAICSHIMDFHIGRSILIGPNNDCSSIESLIAGAGLTNTVTNAAESYDQSVVYMTELYKMRDHIKNYQYPTLYVNTNVINCITKFYKTDSGEPLSTVNKLEQHLRCVVKVLNTIEQMPIKTKGKVGAVMWLPAFYELYVNGNLGSASFDIDYNTYKVTSVKHVHGRSLRPETSSVMIING